MRPRTVAVKRILFAVEMEDGSRTAMIMNHPRDVSIGWENEIVTGRRLGEETTFRFVGTGRRIDIESWHDPFPDQMPEDYREITGPRQAIEDGMAKS